MIDNVLITLVHSRTRCLVLPCSFHVSPELVYQLCHIKRLRRIAEMPKKTRELIATCNAYGRRLTPRHANFRPIYHPEYTPILLETSDTTDMAQLRAKMSPQPPKDRSLYWKIQCGKFVSHKAVVRNWARRRVREAFREALTDRGFDFNGVPLSQDSRYGYRKDLHGSLVMSCNTAMLTASATQLRNDAVLIVDGLSTSTWIQKARNQSPRNTSYKNGFI